MRVLLVLFIFGVFLPNIAFADEFGDRFYNQTPSGLGEYTMEDSEIPDIAMDNIAESMQDIMPAAGEEDISSKQENITVPTMVKPTE